MLGRKDSPLMTFVCGREDVFASLASSRRESRGNAGGGQEDGYLLWELGVVQSGLKDAGWKD